ncbi:MAG: hypothetical protein ACFFDB_00100 [Promethearchaeota archaeon]
MTDGESIEYMFMPLTISELKKEKFRIKCILTYFKDTDFFYIQNKAYLDALNRVLSYKESKRRWK